jgi:hypothetical protein
MIVTIETSGIQEAEQLLQVLKSDSFNCLEAKYCKNWLWFLNQKYPSGFLATGK